MPRRHVMPDTLSQTSPAPLAHGTRGTNEMACDLVLPDAFALRLEARGALTPRSPARCPLEATALRQWCVRLRNDACPLEAVEAPVFLKRC